MCRDATPDDERYLPSPRAERHADANLPRALTDRVAL